MVRGSSGSPVTANTMPAVSTGRPSFFAGVGSSLGNLSGPRVTFPEFVSKDDLNAALKVVQGDIRKQGSRIESLEKTGAETQRELEELGRLVKGKYTAFGLIIEPKSTTIADTSFPPYMVLLRVLLLRC